MANREIHFSFFKATDPMERAMRRMYSLPPHERLKEIAGHRHFCVEQVEDRKNGRIFWLFAKLRMGFAPAKGSLGGKVFAIALKDDEGIAELAGVLYDIKSQVLVLQSTQAGPSATSLAVYLSSDENVFALLPCLNIADLEDVEQRLSYTKLEFAMAPVTEPIKSGDPDIDNLLDLQHSLSNPTISITISAGHSWKTSPLSFEAVKRMVEKLIGRGETSKLRVTARDENEERLFNLVAKNAQRKYTAAVDESLRHLQLAQLQPLLRQAWEDYESDLGT